MSGGWYLTGLKNTIDGTYPFDGSETFKLMLVGTGYTFNVDHALVDPATNDAADLHHNEVVADNYTGGFGGGGRKSVTVSVQIDTTNNELAMAISADQTWTNIGHSGAGTNNDTIGYVALIKEVSADTDSVPIACWDVTDFGTDGTSALANFATLAAGGNLYATPTVS